MASSDLQAHPWEIKYASALVSLFYVLPLTPPVLSHTGTSAGDQFGIKDDCFRKSEAGGPPGIGSLFWMWIFSHTRKQECHIWAGNNSGICNIDPWMFGSPPSKYSGVYWWPALNLLCLHISRSAESVFSGSSVRLFPSQTFPCAPLLRQLDPQIED